MEFGELTVTAAELPKIERKRVPAENPFLPHVKSSYEQKSGLSVTVEAFKAKAAVNFIRRAAETLELGVRVVVQDSRGQKKSAEQIKNAEEKKSNTAWTVLFEAKDKRNYPARKTESDAAEQAPEETPTA